MTKNELLKEANRKLRNLKRAGYMTPARENLEKHFGRGYIKSIDDMSDRYEAKKFIAAATSTAAGYKKVRKAQTANFKQYLKRMVPNMSQYTPEERSKIEAVIDSWTDAQVGMIAKTYKPIITAMQDSDQEAITINNLLFDKISRYAKSSVAKINDAILSPRSLKKEDRAIIRAQISAMDYSQKEGDKIAQKIREARQ